jgi:glycosyltransferase involved in cell wall biosynthesis
MTLQLGHLTGFILGFIPEVLALRNVLKKHPADVIHCNGCWQVKGMIAARLAGTTAPVVYHLNDTHTRKIIKIAFTFLAQRWVDAFFPACERSKEYYLKDTPLAGKPSFIIPAPVDTVKFNPDAVAADPQMETLPGLKIITVCNVHQGKGIDELFALCVALAKSHPHHAVSFCVVGPAHKNHTTYLNTMKNKIEENQIENFHFMGGTDNVPAALKAADIYVCVSHFESSPMAVWEAMSMGKPIVSTDVGDVKSYLEQGRCGFCVPVGDVDKMKESILTLIQDKDLRTEMGRNARQFAVKNLDLEMCAEKHASFYKELLHQKEKNNERFFKG